MLCKNPAVSLPVPGKNPAAILALGKNPAVIRSRGRKLKVNQDPGKNLEEIQNPGKKLAIVPTLGTRVINVRGNLLLKLRSIAVTRIARPRNLNPRPTEN